MPKFDINIPHSLSVEEVRTRLDQAKGKLEANYGTQCTWKGEREMQVSRKGLDGRVHIEENQVRVNLDLGLLLTPMAGVIRSGIEKELTSILS